MSWVSAFYKKLVLSEFEARIRSMMVGRLITPRQIWISLDCRNTFRDPIR